MNRYNELVDYKNEHGHANPPKKEGQLEHGATLSVHYSRTK